MLCLDGRSAEARGSGGGALRVVGSVDPTYALDGARGTSACKQGEGWRSVLRTRGLTGDAWLQAATLRLRRRVGPGDPPYAQAFGMPDGAGMAPGRESG